MTSFAEFSAARSFGFNHYVHALEQSRLLYVHALVLREAPIKPSGVSFVRWAKGDALPLAVAQLELIPHVVFVRTFTHVAATFLPTALWTAAPLNITPVAGIGGASCRQIQRRTTAVWIPSFTRHHSSLAGEHDTDRG